jgi:hypothetical protein
MDVEATRFCERGNLSKNACYYRRAMAIGGTHADYDASLAQWARARDVIAGEDAVKAAGAKYLPRLDSQSEEEYAAYRARASFFGATARTLEEYLDLIFRRAPGFAPCATAGRPAGGLEKFVADCDRWGLSLFSMRGAW